MRDEGRWEEREGIVMERRKVKEEKKEREQMRGRWDGEKADKDARGLEQDVR